MKRQGSTLFLKFVIFFIGLIMFVLLAWFPQTEGRAKDLDLISIYNDPFIIYIYIASIPFFVALYQAFKLLGFIERNKVFSKISVATLRNIKYCAIAIICFLVIAMILVRVGSGDDDPAGALAVGMGMTFAAIVIATAAGVFQKLLQKAVDIKSENDLTV